MPGQFLLLPPLIFLLGFGGGRIDCIRHDDARPSPATEVFARASTLLVQLQDLEPADVRVADPDVLVTDYSWEGCEDSEMTAEEVADLKSRAGGGRRIVLAYLSIGEAEDYRFYWNGIKGDRSLIARRNPRWKGNYLVRYWKPRWHRILYDGPGSYLDRILDQGFDGVFLDTVDVAEVMEARGVKDAAARMADLVTALAAKARAVNPGFIVVVQNPFVILEHDGVDDAIDGISIEDVLFHGGKRLRGKRYERLISRLASFRKRGKAVFLIEYIDSVGLRKELAEICGEHGFLCYTGPLLLGGIGWMVTPGAPGG